MSQIGDTAQYAFNAYANYEDVQSAFMSILSGDLQQANFNPTQVWDAGLSANTLTVSNFTDSEALVSQPENPPFESVVDTPVLEQTLEADVSNNFFDNNTDSWQ